MVHVGWDAIALRRRADDRFPRSWITRAVAGLSTGDDLRPDAVRIGRLLLAACGVTTVVMMPWLGPDAMSIALVATVAVAMTGLVALSFVLPWSRWPQRAALAFPAAVMTSLVLMSAHTPGVVAPLSGLLTLCFAQIGLTQRSGTAVFALLPGAVTFVVVNDGWSRAVGIRMVIAVLVWLLLAETLAGLTTRQAKLAARLDTAAHTDVLTGIGNRRDLQTRLVAAHAGDTLVVCDLDHFKQLNDTRGHAAGDAVLADFGALLRLTLRGDDYCARMGGEEFVLVLHDTDTGGALHLLGRLRQQWATVQPHVTFSAGVAVLGPDEAAVTALAAADEALYAAKHAGRDTDRVARRQPAREHRHTIAV